MSLRTYPLPTDVPKRERSPGALAPSPLPLLPGPGSASPQPSQKQRGNDPTLPLVLSKSAYSTFARATIDGTSSQYLTARDGMELWSKDAVFRCSKGKLEVHTPSSDASIATYALIDEVARLSNQWTYNTTSAGTYNRFYPLGIWESSKELDSSVQALNNSLKRDWAFPLGVRKTGFNETLDDPQDSTRNLSMSDQVHNPGISFDELWLTLYACFHNLTPPIEAATLYGGWPIYISHSGMDLDRALTRGNVDFSALGAKLWRLMTDASVAGLLTLDIKLGNMVVTKNEDAENAEWNPWLIDFDPNFTAVFPKDSEWASCVFLINSVMLVRFTRCRKNTSRSRLMLTPLIEAMRIVATDIPQDKLCSVLQTYASQVFSWSAIPEAETFEKVARHILFMNHAYTNFSGQELETKGDYDCEIEDYDATKPAWPQLVADALK
jgi:hypothetical protein